MKELLQAACASHPSMQARDGIKLMYQAVLGCGHFAPNKAAARAYLDKEWASITPRDTPLLTPLGGEYVRLDLHAAKSLGIPKSLVLRLFLASAAAPAAEDKSRLDRLLSEINPKEFGFDPIAWQENLAMLRGSGYAPVSHSQAYHNAYKPAYRVVSAAYVRWLPLLTMIEKKLAEQGKIIIAADGRAASGKSTFAEVLLRLYGASVVHMDDFFLPMERKTAARMAEAGGNVDYERFCEEVLPGLASGSLAYRPFSCKTQRLQSAVTLPAAAVTLVEGSYALHPRMAFPYDLSFFLTVASEVQSRRILIRNGEEIHQRYMKEWIPMEEKYFHELQIPARADSRFDTGREEILQTFQL